MFRVAVFYRRLYSNVFIDTEGDSQSFSAFFLLALTPCVYYRKGLQRGVTLG